MENKNSDTPKVGVFVCHCGGNISDVIDVKKVAEEAGKLEGVAFSMDYIFMCSDPGQNLIKEAIASGKINRVVVAACSPRLHELTFRRAMTAAGLNPYLLEQANIREQASWVHKMDHEGATDKAIRLTKAAVEKVKLSKPLDMIEIKSLPSAVVIGGGIAGLRAAIDISKKGSTVYLLEKEAFLGGNTVKMGALFPTGEDAKDIAGNLISEALTNEKIKIFTRAEVIEASGGIGNYKVKVKVTSRGTFGEISNQEYEKAAAACRAVTPDPFMNNVSDRKAIYKNYPGAYPANPAIDYEACTFCGKCSEILNGRVDLYNKEEVMEIEAGVVVAATGYEHYEPYAGEYGCKKHPCVITLPQLISLMQTDEYKNSGQLMINGRKIKTIGFMHCVGSRELEGYKKPENERRLNAHCSRVCCTATLQAELELKEKFKNLDIFSFYQDIRAYGRDHEVKYYDKASRAGVIFMRYDPRELPEVREEKGKVIIKMKDLLTMREEYETELDALVLSTGIMPAEPGKIADSFKIPKSADRFLQEVHPKLRPVETAVGGFFLAGTCQAPFDTTETVSGAGAAAVKAASILEGGDVKLEPYVAKVDETKCSGTGKCIEVCPAKGAIYMNARNKAEVNPVLCISCGNCVSACPSRAIDINGYEIRQFTAIIDAILGVKA